MEFISLIHLRVNKENMSVLILFLAARVVLDAHNCYPYDGQWKDRIERALGTGLPIAVEQDLAWHMDPATGKAWSVLSHEAHTTGDEPTLQAYFFERVRPIVETALKRNDRSTWPLITLNLDFKTEEPAHLHAVWLLLKKYESWLTSAERGARADEVKQLDIRPILVLTGESDAQEAAFHDAVPVGNRLLVFGAGHPTHLAETNYRRWWNNPWSVVEEGGQVHAGDWTTADNQHLTSMVDKAHRLGLWIRFYTLNGHSPSESLGWSAEYNFGSHEAARSRWEAAIRAGVDFIATDQYEEFAAIEREVR